MNSFLDKLKASWKYKTAPYCLICDADKDSFDKPCGNCANMMVLQYLAIHGEPNASTTETQSQTDLNA